MGIMNKLLLFLLLLPFGASAQLIQKNTTYGLAFNRTGADTLFYLPVDTFAVPTAYRTYNFMARKATTLYIWNTSTFAWQAVSSGGGAAGWELTGNSGTTAGTNFIGTTDAVALVVKTNNTERARVLSGGNVGIGTSSPDSMLTVEQGIYGKRGVRFTGLTSSANATDSMMVINASNGAVGYRAIPSGGGSSYTFTNGLTESGGTVKWGGRLQDATTTIDANGNEILFDNVSQYSINVGSFDLNASSSVIVNTLPATDTTEFIVGYRSNGQLVKTLKSSSGWQLTGNSGTTAGTNFIGTTDKVALVVKTNNTERARVLSGGNVGIRTSSPDSTFQVNGGLKFVTGRQGTGKILISGSNGGADWGSGQRFGVTGEDNSATAGRIMDMNNYPLRIDSMQYLYMAATRASDTSKQVFRMQQFPNNPEIKRASIISSDPRYQGSVIIDFDHVTLESYNLNYGTNKFTQIISDPDNGADMSSNFLGKNSNIRVVSDSIQIRPNAGAFSIDSLNHSTTSTDKMMVWDSVGQRVATRNLRWKARVGSTTSSSTPTINTDNVDIYKLTAQAADITSFTTNLSGTPNDGDILEIQITGTAARAITWGSSFVSSTVTLPSTTVTTATLTVVVQYFTTSSYGNNKWVCVNSF